MSRKSEREFVGDGLSDEDFAALNGDGAQDDVTMGSDAVTDPPLDAVQGEGTAPVAEVAPAPATPPVAEPEPKMVDIRALQEARAELRKRDEEFARLDERMKALNEALTKRDAPQPVAPVVPDPEKEPWEHLQYELKTTRDKLQAFEEAQRQSSVEAQQARERQGILDRADYTIAQARQSHPDMDDAFGFAVNAVKEEIDRRLKGAGITGDAYIQKANEMFNATLMQYAQGCPTDPDQAAEHIRRHARYWGWTGMKAPEPAPQQIVTPSAPVVQQPTIQQRADQQQRHMSLSGVNGAETPKKLSAKDLASMSDKEYMALLKTAAGRKAAEEEFGGI